MQSKARLVAGAHLAIFLLMLFASSAHAESISPQANVVVTSNTVRLTFDAPPDLSQTSVNLFTAKHQPVDIGPLQPTGDPLSLTAALPALDPGVYTVVWQSTTPAGPHSGAFGFQYDPAEASPRVLVQPQPQFALPSIDRVVPRWLVYTAILTCIGSLLLRLLVWSPALRTQAQPAWRRTVERRLTRLTSAAMLLFMPASLLQAASEAAAKHPDGLNLAAFGAYLSSPGAGSLWSVRLVLIALASTSFALAVLPLRRTLRFRVRYADRLFAGSVAICAGELLVRTLPSDLTSDTGRTLTTWLLDWTHLVGAGVWVGGLIGLAVTASLLRPSRGAPPHIARVVIRRFSNMAIVCVGALTISGTWSAWVHVGSPDLLLTTLYGRTLLLKLTVVAVLVALGATNLLHVLPRLEAARRSDSDRPSLITAALRHFRRLVILEAALGVVVLAIVPFLAGSARTQDAQVHSANLAQTAMIGALPVTFTPSALQPGLVEYDLTLPAAYTGRVSMTFDSPELGVPPIDVVAVAHGSGAYRASGVYTPMAGDWHVQVQLTNGSAQFDLPVRAEPVAPPANRAPAIDSTTLAVGVVEIVAVVLALQLASKLSVAISSMLLARPGRRAAR